MAVTAALLWMAMHKGSFRLPPDARITIGRSFRNESWHDDTIDQNFCKTYTTTTAAMRHRFATYHELGETERHDWYQEINCFLDGTVEVQGKVYKWAIQPENLMQTTWPDGNWHSLGGAHSITPKDYDGK